MVALLVVLLLVADSIGSSSQAMNETEQLFLARQHADRFQEAFRDAYEDQGVQGLGVYFLDDFEAINFQGLIYRKDQYLRHLSEYSDATYWFFHNYNQAFFDMPQQDLVVRFYHNHLLHEFRLVPNRSLLGGYQLKKLAYVGAKV